MLIIGAKGFAKEVFEIFNDLNQLKSLAFYDDVNPDVSGRLFELFPILKNKQEVKEFFIENGKKFTIGVGNPILRHKLYEKFIKLGGEIVSTISPFARIGSKEVYIGIGSNVLCNSVISNSVSIGKCCIIYYNVTITHDCHIGDFVELSPNVIILGNVHVGSFTQIGANATILPNLKIGNNVTIGAGSIVTKDIPDNCLVYGVPSRIVSFKKELEL